jgi:hypothetical protein
LDRVALNSTLLASAGHDPRRHLLEVEFRSGELYRFFNVPSACYQELLRADSKGGYFNVNIRNLFPYQHLSHRASPVVLSLEKTK